MIGLENWEVLPLTPEDREAIQGIFGLNRFCFQYVEKVGSQTVRLWNVASAQTQAVFPSPSSDLADSDSPVLLRTHLAHQLAESPLYASAGLWDELLPFPLSAWGASSAVELSGKTESSSLPWWQAAVQARVAFEEFQARLFSAEISVVRFKGASEQEMVLFFHAVRKRFLVLGKLQPVEGTDWAKLPDLEKLAASFQRLELSFSLKETFPAQWQEVTSQLRSEPREASVCLAQPSPQSISTPLPL